MYLCELGNIAIWSSHGKMDRGYLCGQMNKPEARFQQEEPIL